MYFKTYELANVQDVFIISSISHGAQKKIDGDVSEHQERLNACGYCAPTKRLLMPIPKDRRQGNVFLNQPSNCAETRFRKLGRILGRPPNSPVDRRGEQSIDYPRQKYDSPETIHCPA